MESEPPKNPLHVVRIAHIESTRAEPEWLVESLWGDQAVGFVGGTPKSCKTWLALELAVAVASGKPCLGRFIVRKPGHVLLYAAEDNAADIRHRVAGIASARGVNLERLAIGLITEPKLQLDVPSHQNRLADTLEKLKPRLLVLDPLVRLHGSDENSAADISQLLAYLRSLQRAYEVAILVVHHVRKATAGQPGQSLRGSGDLHAWSDSNLYLLHQKGDLRLHAEHRNHAIPEPLTIRLASGPPHLEVSDDAPEASPSGPDDAAGQLACRIVEMLRQQPMTRTRLRDQLRVRNETLGEVLTGLEAQGRVHRVDGRLAVPRSAP